MNMLRNTMAIIKETIRHPFRESVLNKKTGKVTPVLPRPGTYDAWRFHNERGDV